MPVATTTCPFCNAVVPLAEPTPVGKAVCPRCGETFPLRSGADTSAGPSPAAAELDAEVQRHRQARQRQGARSVRNAVIVALSLGVLGVLIGLGVNYLRPEQTKEQPAADVAAAPPVAPAEMPGLGYLPPGTDSVIAIQLRPVIAGLPNLASADPRSALIRLGISAEIVTDLDRASGVGLDNVDQVVLGLKLRDGSLLNQVVLVIHTRQRFSMEELADRWKAIVVKKGDRTYYRLPAGPKFPIELHWWSPHDRVLVVSPIPAQLDSIAAEPRDGLSHLAGRSAEIIGKQLAADTYFWAVLDSEQWETLGFFLATLGAKRGKAAAGAPDVLSTLRTLVVSMRFQPDPSVTMWLDLKLEKAAIDLRNTLAKKFADNVHVTVGGAGNRVLIRTSATSAGIAALLEPILRGNKY